jgi:hypothetical protein
VAVKKVKPPPALPTNGGSFVGRPERKATFARPRERPRSPGTSPNSVLSGACASTTFDVPPHIEAQHLTAATVEVADDRAEALLRRDHFHGHHRLEQL